MHFLENLIGIGQVPSALLDYVLYPFITIILCLLSVFVVLGNLLVVTAIWHENQLHSVTNYLIASLAAADCLVGAVVMPFSIISEIILGSWTFGPVWCDLWHSFDVLASTASIMNLCAISLDRYLAITNPICYPTKMTPKRVALLIVSLWTCSSLISFPAIIWWRAVGKGPLQQISPSIEETTQIAPATMISNQQREQTNQSHETTIDIVDNFHLVHIETQASYRCVFTDDTYYLLFSSIVSFYGPLCVMLYAYIRIYQAAVQQTRFLKHGSKQVMIGGNKKNKRQRYTSELSNQDIGDKYAIAEAYCNGKNIDSCEPQHLVLRAHRGGGGGASNSQALRAKGDLRGDHKRQQIVSNYKSDEDRNFKEQPIRGGKAQILYYDSDKLIQSIVDLTAIHYIDCTKQGGATTNTNNEPATTSTTTSTIPTKSILSKQTSNQIGQVKSITLDQVESQEDVSCTTLTNVPRQQRSVGKLAKERKAAKTLGIVVGVFILCWLPFFVVNILVALCGTSCIYKPQILFSIVTWLGWLNSAMNPVIYACWSRDFRRAFRKVLCTWVEFLCYDGTKLARKLKLKKGSSYANTQHEVYLNRTASTVRIGTSTEGMSNNGGIGGGSSSTSSGLRLYGSGVAQKTLLSDQ